MVDPLPAAELPDPDAVNGFLAAEYPAMFATGMRCEETAPMTAVARWTYDPTQLRPGGLISGPTQFALADVAFWFATFTILGLAPMAVTSNLSIDFLRPAVGGDLLARAMVLRAGRTRITARVDLWVDGAEDSLVGHATGGYGVLDLRH